jgi:predicted metal-dependent phosphoesterase TrpH
MNSDSDRLDLHIHTTFSDGDMAPEQVVAEAKNLGLAGIAITDHDEVDGVEVATESAGDSGFRVVSGVELRDMGVNIEVDSVLEIAGEGAVGRPHIAAALLQNGCVKSVEEAFKQYIGFNSPAYVPKYQLKPSDAFRLIRGAGGVGAMSHPGTTRRDDLITDFIANGMRALEVYHPKHGEADIARYKRLAEKMGLVITGGSDSHGMRNPKLRIGVHTVPLATIEELEKARSY